MNYKESLISIVIPVYNRENLIIECLKSIVNQTYNNWEAIIVDDGSADNTISIVKQFVERDRRFTLLNRNRLPKGGSTCRNIGLQNANGDYIIFLDSDDILASYCIKQRVDLLQANNYEFDLGIFRYKDFYNEPEDNQKVSLLFGENRIDYLKSFLEFNPPWQTMCGLWKKSVIEKLGGFDERFQRLQDNELHTRALLNKQVSIKFFKDTLFDSYYRVPFFRLNGGDKLSIISYNKISIVGRYLYLKTFTQLIKKSSLSSIEKTNFMRCLSIFCKVFYKKKLINNIKENKFTYFRTLSFARENELLDPYDIFILKVIAHLWLKENRFTKHLKLKGIFYHLF